MRDYIEALLAGLEEEEASEEAAELVERWDLPRDFLVPEEESR